jgi:TRAP-type transport system small permease protein
LPLQVIVTDQNIAAFLIMIKTILNKIEFLSSLLGQAGGIILFCMMLLTVCDVTGRYIFNAPITGAYEVTETMMVTIVFFFIAYTQAEKGHIAVDLVVIRLPDKIRVLVQLITHGLSLCIFLLILWMNILRWLELMARNEHTPIIHLPISPFLLIVAFGSLVFSIELIKDVMKLFKHRDL